MADRKIDGDSEKGVKGSEEKEALQGMVEQFAYWSEKAGGFTTGGLSALEDAFRVLGWEDPHPAPWARCDEPDCMDQATCGTPTMNIRDKVYGYRRTCSKHRPK
jgi:hypothetical protein